MRWQTISLVTLVVLCAVAGIIVYLQSQQAPPPQQCVGNVACFLEAANTCADASMDLSTTSGSLRLVAGDCKLSKYLISLEKESTLVKSVFEGLNMTCSYTAGSLTYDDLLNTWWNLDNCQGDLATQLRLFKS